MAISKYEIGKRFRDRRKQERRCVVCGRQDERTLNCLTRCKECTEHYKQYYQKRRTDHPEVFATINDDNKAWYYALKANHVCVKCRGQDAYTLGGRPYCAECTSIENQRRNMLRSKDLQAERDRQRKLRMRRIDEHRCSRCGKPLRDGYSYKLCEHCRYKLRISKDEQRWLKNPDRIKRGTPGFCWNCCQPVMEGKKICERCYKALLPGLAKAREAQKANREKLFGNGAVTNEQRKIP